MTEIDIPMDPAALESIINGNVKIDAAYDTERSECEVAVAQTGGVIIALEQPKLKNDSEPIYQRYSGQLTADANAQIPDGYRVVRTHAGWTVLNVDEAKATAERMLVAKKSKQLRSQDEMDRGLRWLNEMSW